MTSRLDKFVRELTGVERLVDASRLRAQPIELLVGQRTPVALLRSAVALVLRCFGDAVHVGCLEALPSTMADAALLEAQEYGARDRISFERTSNAVALGLGCRRGNETFVDARAWTAGVNRFVNGGEPSSVAASFAACAGIAKLFGRAIGRDAALVDEAWSISLLSLDQKDDDRDPNDINFGRLLVIGGGAIGSGFVHTLRGSGWRGHVEIVDRERYDEPNHETTLVISQQHARDRAKKAETLASLLNGAGITSHGSQEEISEESALLAEHWDAVIVAVDNAELRRALDHVNAPILNAGVGGSRDDAGHVLFSRHLAADPLLSALYRSRSSAESSSEAAPSDIKDECSRIEYARTSLAAPFLGLAAGALLAAGLAQLALQFDVDANYVKLDLLGNQSRFLREQRRR